MTNIASAKILTSLPMQSGVSPSKVVLPAYTNLNFYPKTLFDFLCQFYPHIHAHTWRQRLIEGQIFLGVGDCFWAVNLDEDYVSHQGKTLYYYRFVNDEVVVPFCHHWLFENERFLVVDKPHFLTMTPSGQHVKETLLTRLKDETNNGDLTPIHRLDKETAGVVLFCKDKRYRGAYQTLFVKQAIDKCYHAIAPFKHTLTFPLSLTLSLQRGEPFYTMQVTDGKPNSETWIQLLAVDDCHQWAKYELRPKTGKLHQLRVHLNHLGLPIKHDPYYPSVCHKAADDFSCPLQLLAKSVGFIDPIDQQSYHFVAKRTLQL